MGVGENLQRSLEAHRVTPISVTEGRNQKMCWIMHEYGVGDIPGAGRWPGPQHGRATRHGGLGGATGGTEVGLRGSSLLQHATHCWHIMPCAMPASQLINISSSLRIEFFSAPRPTH